METKNLELKCIVDIRSLEQGGQLIARAGTIVNFISDEGDYVVAELKDGSIAFPMDEGEYEIVDDGASRHEVDGSEEALFMSRGKAKGKVVCPHCNGTTLDLSQNEDGGTCPHCFDGYVSE